MWESLPADAPDGLAIAQSGNVYLALAGASQVLLLSPEFAELARVPPNPAANQSEEIPVDSPGSLAFLGDRVLVTNHSAIRGDPDSWAILDVFADEAGLPLHHPQISKPRLLVKASLGAAARRLHVHVTRHLASKTLPVRRARVRAAGVRARTGRRGRATISLPVPEGVAAPPIVVRARKHGFRHARLVLG